MWKTVIGTLHSSVIKYNLDLSWICLSKLFVWKPGPLYLSEYAASSFQSVIQWMIIVLLTETFTTH